MMRWSSAIAHRQTGFTLLEVLVAFVIFALSIGALYESFGGSLRRTLKAEVEERAWLSAQSLLAEIRVRPAPWPAEEEGETPSGLDWKRSSALYPSNTDSGSSWRAYQVVIEVHPHSKVTNAVVLRSVELVDVSDVARRFQAGSQ